MGRALCCVIVCAAASTAGAAELRVGPGESIQAAIDAAGPGDVVVIEAGTYDESLVTAADGTAQAPIAIRGEGEVVVTSAGRVLRVQHEYNSVEGVILDGQYGDRDAVRIDDTGNYFALRGSEVRFSGRDCVDMGAPRGVVIDDSVIHHCLNATGGRTDAHGIVGGAVRDVTIRNTEVHSFSGDAIQFDPGRSAPGWSGVTIEGCRFWLAPLPADANGFTAGTVPGENAIDTKTPAGTTATIVVSDTTAFGFRGGLISNMAAFNMKEDVEATFDRVTVYDSEIAFRLRAPADVRVQNTIVYDVDTAVRYEDGIAAPEIFNSTFGRAVVQAFDEASSASTVIDARNLLVLADALPPEANGASNLAVTAAAFAAASGDDYHLVEGSPAVDVGVAIAGIDFDRDGVARPQGASIDVGAFELCTSACETLPDGGPSARPDAGGGGDPGGDASGCGCSTDPHPTGGVWLLALAAVLGRQRRRRARARSTTGVQ